MKQFIKMMMKEVANYLEAFFLFVLLLYCFVLFGGEIKQYKNQHFVEPLIYQNIILNHRVQALTIENNILIEINHDLRHKLFEDEFRE